MYYQPYSPIPPKRSVSPFAVLFVLLGGLATVAFGMYALNHIPGAQAQQPSIPIITWNHTPTAPHGLRAKGAPTIARDRVDQILCDAQSPACGTGQDLYDFARLNGVDPAFALAMFHHESDYGRSGVARVTHSLGNIRCAGFAPCMSGYRAYTRWLSGYEDFFRVLQQAYFAHGRVTLEQIIPVYAPAGDHNNVAAYIRAVEQDMTAWHS